MSSYVAYGFWVKELDDERKRAIDNDDRLLILENESGIVVAAEAATWSTDLDMDYFNPDRLNVIQGTQSLLENAAIRLRIPLKPSHTRYFFVREADAEEEVAAPEDKKAADGKKATGT